MRELTDYRYRGARAMVLLHERHMLKFLDSWRKAKSLGVALPPTDDPNCASLDTLLRHVVRAARGYMVWICEKLELPDPEMRPAPEVESIEVEVESYFTHLFHEWRKPLKKLPEERFYKPEYLSRWQVNYCIDAMLEHAVMHPLRHQFQLEELMEK